MLSGNKLYVYVLLDRKACTYLESELFDSFGLYEMGVGCMVL